MCYIHDYRNYDYFVVEIQVILPPKAHEYPMRIRFWIGKVKMYRVKQKENGTLKRGELNKLLAPIGGYLLERGPFREGGGGGGLTENFFGISFVFQYVGQALLSVLEEGLGEAFTPELKAAWSDAYTIITDIMMGAINDYNAN